MQARSLLPPDSVKDRHDIRGMAIRGSIIEIGKGQYQDFISESVLEDCEIRIFCGASNVNIFRTTLINCEIRPKKEMKNLRLTDVNIDGCIFHGRYTGLRLGSEDPERNVSIRNCDFTLAKLRGTDFLPGVDIESMRLPTWPHITVINVAQHRASWLALQLPDSMKILQEIIGEPDQWALAVTLLLTDYVDNPDDWSSTFAGLKYVRIVA